MNSQTSVVSDEMKTFLQEGLSTYAPALVALSEFRRQIRTRLQAVLEERSTELAELGLSVENIGLKSARLDDQNLETSSSSIELEKNYGGDLYANYHVIWDLEEPKDRQVRVGAWIWLGIRADRDRLFSALQKQRSPMRKTRLMQDRNGLSRLLLYSDPDRFYGIDDTFRTLAGEWVDHLSGIGGVQPYLSTAESR